MKVAINIPSIRGTKDYPKFVFPDRCICCLGLTETSVKFESNKIVLFGHIESTIEVPFCRPCTKHDSEERKSNNTIVILIFAPILIAFFLIGTLSGYVLLFALLILVISSIAVFKLYLGMEGKRARSFGRNCTAFPFLFSVDGDEAIFSFGNNDYGALFLEANPHGRKHNVQKC